MVVVAADVLEADELELTDVFRSREKAVSDLIIDVLPGGLDVDDGTKIVFTKEVVALGGAATNVGGW